MRRWQLLAAVFLFLLLLLRSNGVDEEEEFDLEELDDDLESGESTNYEVVKAKAKNLLIDVTDQNAHRIINSQEYVLLLGYASWCTRSSALMPEFAAAASTLSELGSTVLLAKLDAVVNTRAASSYNIKGFPTMLFFINGSHQFYEGGDTKEEIVNWVRKRTGSPSAIITSAADAQAVLAKNITLVVGFFRDFECAEYQSFIEAAKQEIGTEFVHTSDIDAARFFNPKIQTSPLIWVHKTQPERFVAFTGQYRTEEILKFVELHKLPLVVELTPKNSASINMSPIKHQVFLFGKGEEVGEVLDVYKAAAHEFKYKLLFLRVDSSDEDFSMPLLSVYGLMPIKPIVAGFNYENGFKYLLEEEDITMENLKSFCEGFLSGELKQHYKSEDIPSKKQGEGHVVKVVGKNFDAIVMDESKDVLLVVSTRWCSGCSAADKAASKLASLLKDVSSVVVARFDASLNEHPELQVENYPSFILYPAGSELKKNPVIASDKFSSKSLLEFMKTNAAIAFRAADEEVIKNDEL